MKEEILDMRKQVKEVQEQSIAMSIVKSFKKQAKMFFIIWIITFIAFVGLLSYTIYLINDIGTKTVKETQTYDFDAENGVNNFIGGDNNGTNEVHKN